MGRTRRRPGAPDQVATPEEPVTEVLGVPMERTGDGATDPPVSGSPVSGPPPPFTVEAAWSALTVPSIWAVVIALVLGALFAFVGADYERTRPSVYQSDAVLLLDNPVAITSDPGSVLAVSEDRAKYAGLVGTDLIARPAAAALGMPQSAVEGVRAVADPSSLDLLIVAKSASPLTSQRLANGVAGELVLYVDREQASLPSSVPVSVRLRLTLISSAKSGGRVSPTHRKELTTGAVIGIVALAVGYVASQLVVDARRRRRSHRAGAVATA